MAHIHGEPARYPWSQGKRMLKWAMSLMAIFFMVIGAAIAIGIEHYNSWKVVLALCCILPAPWLFENVFDRATRKLMRERLFHVRGSRAEVFVGWLLQDLDDDWHIFHGIQLEAARDIDHILIGPGGVFIVSTKADRGMFSLAADGSVLKNGQPTSLAGNTVEQAMRLRLRLEAVLGFQDLFVTAVLAVPFMFVDFTNPQKSVWFMHQDNLIQTIESFRNKLSKQEVARYVKAMVMLAANAENLYRPDEAKALVSEKRNARE